MYKKQQRQNRLRKQALATSIGILLTTGGVPGVGLAQDADEESADQEVVIVTGTRIRRDDFSSPNATTVVSADDMRNLGITSVAGMINQLPNNVASITPEASANDVFNMGASIANLRGLNTYAGTRTLTLVDSRRFVPSNNGGGVDLNMIPTALVGRIETVTGGASATYGADAMAGVVNVIIDDNVEGIRMDLSYNQTGEGDGENYNLSLGTGFQFFESRGNLTIGYDHSKQDGIFDCTTRALCQSGRSLIRNGESPGTGWMGIFPADPYTGPRDNVLFEDQPEWMVLDGMRYHLLPEGLLWGIDSPVGEPTGYTDASDYTLGIYQLNAAGTDVTPYLDGLTLEQQALVFQEGPREDSPWGEGDLTYKNISMIPENTRDNLFTSFSYDFDNGITVDSRLTYGKSESLSKQNSARQSQFQACVFPDNAFLDPRAGATDRLIEVFSDRRSWNTVTYEGEGAHSADMTNLTIAENDRTGNPNDVKFGDGFCRPAPWIGRPTDPTALGPLAYDMTYDAGAGGFRVMDFPRNGGTYLQKDLGPFINRTNSNETETLDFSIGASGDLFDGSAWTWDAYVSYGKTERSAFITDWQSKSRLDMAMFSVYDDELGPVCATDPRLADQVSSTDIYDQAFYNDVRAKWELFLAESLQDEAWLRDANGDVVYDSEFEPVIDDDLVAAYFADLQFGCAPFNPLGTNPGPSAASLAYAFPEMIETTENTQRAASITLSGDAWRGFGAGPLRMAGGIDWRENITGNATAQQVSTARDFKPGGDLTQGTQVGGGSGTNIDIALNFGDNWAGVTTTSEAFVELELPLLADKVAADYLMINVANRRTRNETRRTDGTQEIDVTSVTRYQDSWKASMVWQPVDLLRVRATRSTDTRAPSGQELFQTNSPAVDTGARQEVVNPFRNQVCNDLDEVYDENDPCPISGTDVWARRDLAESFQGGNSNLSSETSVTETLGLVFSPTQTIPGLQVSVDYYETLVDGGIENVTRGQTLNGCSLDVLAQVPDGVDPTPTELLAYADSSIFCDNIDFGDPDPDPAQLLPDGSLNPFSNIQSVATSRRNVSAYWSRGIDVSVSYTTQLSAGGILTGRVLATRFLEQSVDTEGVFGRLNVAGQTGSNGLNRRNFNLGTNYSPTPRISGNMFLTYSRNAFSVTGQLRYVGSGKLYVQEGWIGPGDVGYANSEGTGGTLYTPQINTTVYDSTLPSWTTLNLNFNYNFSRSSLNFDRFEDLSAYFNIENVGDRVPNFFSGTGAGGVNNTFFSGLGRQFRMGVRMHF